MHILPYHPKLAPHFKTLNLEWLDTYFYVEPYDKEVLSKPEEYIINKGGHIFFAVDSGTRVIGTVALMPTATKGILELTKMAVVSSERGKGVGHQLLTYCISFARKEQLVKLVLYSNTKLENAIHLYKKYGFIEIPLEIDVTYKRANIKMERTL